MASELFLLVIFFQFLTTPLVQQTKHLPKSTSITRASLSPPATQQQPNSNTNPKTMSSSTFSVKAQLADDIRRVRIPTDIAGAASSLGATFATDAALIQIYWTGE